MILKGANILLAVIICGISIENALGWRTFWKGRRNDGNLHIDQQVSFQRNSPPAEWFDQKLDHFDQSNNELWKQRYFVNDSFYKSGGPIFLMIGGEGAAQPTWMIQGAWIHYAQEMNALCFQLEHRFYGESKPTKDLSVESLKYLSSEQALADLAGFIKSKNAEYGFDDNVKWIAFGGSYPGCLAAWLREKYPHLVYGSVSTSGPLLAKADFYEYYDVVKASLATYSQDCVKAVQKSFQQVEILLRHMIGQRSLTQKFKLCDPLEQSADNELDVSNFFENLASNFAGVVQYNKDNSPHAGATIDDVCNIMVNTKIGAQIDRLAAVNKLLLDQGHQKCLDYKYDKMIKLMQNTSWESDEAEGSIQWTYQTCNEFGFYQTSDKKESVFGDRFPLVFFVKQCTDIYGRDFNADYLFNSINKTNDYYKGLKPNTTNVLYVHGSIDPWHALGIIGSKDPKLPTIFIEGTAHCANMYEPKDTDFPQLKQAREKIREFLRALINDEEYHISPRKPKCRPFGSHISQ